MPGWCMWCGEAEMPDIGTSVKRTRKGLKWKTPTRLALRRKRITVCGDCWRRVTWEA